jgi:hypothetical protein
MAAPWRRESELRRDTIIYWTASLLPSVCGVSRCFAPRLPSAAAFCFDSARSLPAPPAAAPVQLETRQRA